MFSGTLLFYVTVLLLIQRQEAGVELACQFQPPATLLLLIPITLGGEGPFPCGPQYCRLKYCSL